MTEMERAAYLATIKSAERKTREEIKALRNEGKRFFVIKYKNDLYVTYDISTLRPYLTSHTHLCGECHRCRALPHEAGGCDKIWNRKHSHVYKYDFIRLGVEAFCSGESTLDFFSVTNCSYFKPDPERKNTGVIWYDPEKKIPTYNIRPAHTHAPRPLPHANKIPSSIVWPIGK